MSFFLSQSPLQCNLLVDSFLDIFTGEKGFDLSVHEVLYFWTIMLVPYGSNLTNRCVYRLHHDLQTTSRQRMQLLSLGHYQHFYLFLSTVVVFFSLLQWLCWLLDSRMF